MNLKAYARSNETCLFVRCCRSKADARKAILNHGMLASIDYVIFKGKRYTINQIYKWGKI